MPRKTKKQKIHSQKLRQKTANMPIPQSVNREFNFHLDDFKHKKLEANFAKKSDKSAQSTTSTFDFHDLAKSLGFGLGLILLQIVLYFLWFRQL